MHLVNQASYKHLPLAGVTLWVSGSVPLKMDLPPKDTPSLSMSALIKVPRQQ